MSNTKPETSRERYREIKRLWDEAAKNDWREPVKIIPGFSERLVREMAKWQAEHPEYVSSGPKAPPKARYRIFDQPIES
jgi:hypothetical protein